MSLYSSEVPPVRGHRILSREEEFTMPSPDHRTRRVQAAAREMVRAGGTRKSWRRSSSDGPVDPQLGCPGDRDDGHRQDG